jgi:hypothetical protein
MTGSGPDPESIEPPEYLEEWILWCAIAHHSSLVSPRAPELRRKRFWIASSLSLPCANASRLSQAMTEGRNCFTRQRTAQSAPKLSNPVAPKIQFLKPDQH